MSHVCLVRHSSTATSSTPGPTKTKDTVNASEKTVSSSTGLSNVSAAQQRKIDLAIIKDLLVNVWPKGHRDIKIRVVLALGLLVTGKVLQLSCSSRV